MDWRVQRSGKRSPESGCDDSNYFSGDGNRYSWAGGGNAEVPETTPTPDPTITKPEVDFTQVDGLRTAELALDVSFTDYVFTDETTKSVMDQSTYILSNPGTDSRDI